MPKIEYRHLSDKEYWLVDNDTKGEEYKPSWYEYNTYLCLFVDDKFIRLVFRDGGEPEDQTLGRDLGGLSGELSVLAKYAMTQNLEAFLAAR